MEAEEGKKESGEEGGGAMEKVNMMKRRQKTEEGSRSERCLVCLFSSSAPSLMRLAQQGKKCHTREFRSHENRLARRLPGPVCMFVKWMRLRGPWST